MPAAALLPGRALAAESGLAADGLIDSLLASMQQAEPVTFPRKRLQLNFAVLLMRSGYEAVDDLDFVPMVGGAGRPVMGVSGLGGRCIDRGSQSQVATKGKWADRLLSNIVGRAS